MLWCVCVLLVFLCLSLFVLNVLFFMFSSLVRRKYVMDKLTQTTVSAQECKKNQTDQFLMK